MRPILGVFWCRGRVRVRAGGSWALVLQFNGLGLVPGCFFGLSPASCCHAAEMAKVAAQEQDEPPGGECGKLTFKKATLGEDREINTQTFPDGRCNYSCVQQQEENSCVERRVQNLVYQNNQGNRRKESGMDGMPSHASQVGTKCATWNRNVSG